MPTPHFSGDSRPCINGVPEEELRRLIDRSDAFTNTYTNLEDVPEGQIREDVRRRTLAVLAEESERATEEAHRYKEELGLKD